MTSDVGDVLPDLLLQNARGEEVPISRFVDRTTVIQCLRYYG
jgi:hypothetical protein